MYKLELWTLWQIYWSPKKQNFWEATVQNHERDDERLTYASSLRMYSVQRSYWSSYVNVYSGTAWTISRIKPFDAWLVSLCLHLCMSICAAANSIGDARTLSNRRDGTRRKFAVSLRKGNNVTSLFHQFSLLDRKFSLSLFLSPFPLSSLSPSFFLFLSFSFSCYSWLFPFIRGLLHRIRRDSRHCTSSPSLGSCICASSDSNLSSCDVAPRTIFIFRS